MPTVATQLPIDAKKRLCDAVLIQRFARTGDQQAFEQLVKRHADLVLGVCRRVLRHQEDAHDAFQATFMILARQAHSVRNRSSLASWLYTVAYRTAIRLAKRRIQQAECEMEAEPATLDNALDNLYRQELQLTLDEEISRLPQRLRAPLVLCYLQQRTRSEAAKELNCTEAAVKASLAKGRQILRMRLVRRGISLTTAMAVVMLPINRQAEASQQLIEATVQGCTSYLSTNSSGVLASENACLLAKKGIQTMMLSSLVKPAALTTCVCLLAGASLVAQLQSQDRQKNDRPVTTVQVDDSKINLNQVADGSVKIDSFAVDHPVEQDQADRIQDDFTEPKDDVAVDLVDTALNREVEIELRRMHMEQQYMVALAEAIMDKAKSKELESEAFRMDQNDEAERDRLLNHARSLFARAESRELRAEAEYKMRNAELLQHQMRNLEDRMKRQRDRKRDRNRDDDPFSGDEDPFSSSSAK